MGPLNWQKIMEFSQPNPLQAALVAAQQTEAAKQLHINALN